MSVYAQPYATTSAKLPPPRAGGGSGNPPTGTGVTKTTKQGPVIPTRPDPVGTDPIATPYDADQPLAQKAYDDAVSQLGVQKAATYLSYGVDAQGNELNPSGSPYGLFQQTQLANASRSAGIAAGIRQRGLSGSGIAGQAEDAGQLAAGQGITNLYTNLVAADTARSTGETQAYNDLQTRLLSDKTQGAAWLQQQQLFSPPAATRTDAQVKTLVSQAAAAWKAKFGSLDKKNKAGQTFQDRLNMYGSKLYDPTQTYMFGGKSYGGTT